jgi:hypothetical protein
MLTQAMSRRPADRHATMAELKDEIMRCLARLAEAPVRSRSPRRTDSGMSKSSSPWRRGARAIWITGAGVAAGLGVAALIVSLRPDVRNVRTQPTPGIAAPELIPAQPPMAQQMPVPTPASVESPPSDGEPPSRADHPTGPESSPRSEIVLRTELSRRTKSSRRTDPAHQAATVRAAPASRSHPHARGTAAIPAASGAPPPAASVGSVGSAGPATLASVTAPAAPGSSHGPGDAVARGRAAFAKGNFAEAVRLGRGALATGDGLGGHLLLGDAFYKMERFNEALHEYDAALKTAPGNPLARRGHELAARRAQQ